jgi:hypothetical protein
MTTSTYDNLISIITPTPGQGGALLMNDLQALADEIIANALTCCQTTDALPASGKASGVIQTSGQAITLYDRIGVIGVLFGQSDFVVPSGTPCYCVLNSGYYEPLIFGTSGGQTSGETSGEISGETSGGSAGSAGLYTGTIYVTGTGQATGEYLYYQVGGPDGQYHHVWGNGTYSIWNNSGYWVISTVIGDLTESWTNNTFDASDPTNLTFTASTGIATGTLYTWTSFGDQIN